MVMRMQGGQDNQQAMGGVAMLAIMLTQMAQQVKTKMAVAVTVENQGLTMELAIPKAHLLELAELGAKMQTSMGGPPMGQDAPAAEQGDLGMTFEMPPSNEEVTVIVLGPVDSDREDRINEQLMDLVEGDMASISSMLSENALEVTVAPVPDAKAFADKITFGTVIQIQDRTITVQVK